MPALPSSLVEPVWVEFAALLPKRSEFHPDHPLGCHRRRIPDRVVFDHIVEALVHGSGYELVATAGCSDSTRRRLKAWADAGIAEQVQALTLAEVGVCMRASRRVCRPAVAGFAPLPCRPRHGNAARNASGKPPARWW